VFLACDHNDHVYNFKITLQLLKKKLPDVKEVKELEEIVNKMRYVKYNDIYTHRDHNLFVDAWRKLLEIDKMVSPELAEELEEIVDRMKYIEPRDIYSAEYHNLFREAWKKQEEINKKIVQL